MGSSKKKGQQRKAAAKKALSADTMNSGISGDINNSSSGAVDGSGGSNKIVAKVRGGNNYATKKLTTTLHSVVGFSYEHSGALPAILEFLNRCEDETFEGIMNSVGGDLKSPSLWIQILVTATFVEPSCKLQIAENIGPLVSCMINDTDRLLFKGNKHWREGIVPFINLVVNVMENKDDKTLESEKIVGTMLQYEGLLRSITQWVHWQEYRPDIMKELRTGGKCALIIFLSKRVMELLLNGLNGMEAESRPRLLEIGATPIVNKDYDPNCMTSYTAELVGRLKNHVHAGDFTSVFSTVQRLIRDGDCVDKVVIEHVIDLGLNHVVNYKDSIKVGLLLLEVINKGSAINNYTSDTRTAFAIRTGLIEMCLNFIKRFGDHESFWDDSGLHMHGLIVCMFQSISRVSLHQKTAKAIESVKRSTNNEKNVVKLMANLMIDGTSCMRNSTECRALVIIAMSIIGNLGSYCCRCNKQLSKTQVKLCNGCHRMSYCSKACQKQDWLSGHNLSCCKRGTHETAGQFQGRILPEEAPSDERAAAKLKEIEINMNMIHLRLFLDNSDTILSQASALDIPLYDCVAAFDLRNCSPALKVKVIEYTESFNSEDGIIGFEKSRSIDNIMCVYYSNIYIGDVEEELAMQRFFPHEWLKKQS